MAYCYIGYHLKVIDIASIIAQLERQSAAIDNAIQALRVITGQTATSEKRIANDAPKSRGMSKEGRQRQIEAMRRYWAAKKAGKGAIKKATATNRSRSAGTRKRMAAAQRKR